MEQERILGVSPLAGQPPAPDFDQETTLLSARPVVPLEEVRHAAQARGKLYFGLALLTALVLGAATAMLFDRLRNQEEAQSGISLTAGSNDSNKQHSDDRNSVSLDDTGGKSEQPKQLGPAPGANLPTVTVAESGLTTEKSITSKQLLASSTVKIAKRSSEVFTSGPKVRIEGQRELRQRWRRPELGRQQPSAPAARDLFRIREIFEGQQPPD